MATFSVHVEFMATLRRQKNQPREFTKDVAEGTKIRDLLKEYFTVEELRMIHVLVHDLRVNLEYILNPNDRLFVTIPIGGG